MSIYAISDLHLLGNNDKPMDIFGAHWHGHFENICNAWSKTVTNDDTVLLCGDFCWAMRLEDALGDLKTLDELPGTKVLIRGNHDYWWSTISKMRQVVGDSVIFIQNDSYDAGEAVICGSRGWPSPGSSEYSAHDEKIYKRELIRLELSIESIKSHKPKILMLHYPPFLLGPNGSFIETEFTRLIERHEIKTVLFGHIHKPAQHPLYVEHNSVSYHLTSCDMMGFRIKKIDV
ncbi:MAG: hypothetical protein E7315_05705 [Clostridiales bacterium]|nr:hypothetical protein [Clostridiales bacterium]